MTFALKLNQEPETIMPFADEENNQTSITEMIKRASDVIAPVWPLKTIIACNPLQGLEALPIEQAMARSTYYLKTSSTNKETVEAVNREMIKWLGSYLDDGQATVAMPGRDQGFYRAFLNLVVFDKNIVKNSTNRAWLATLPDDPQEAITLCLQKLNIKPEDQEEYLRQSLAALSGWAGTIKYREEWQSKEASRANPITLADYLAVRLVLSCLLDIKTPVEQKTITLQPTRLDFAEREKNYRNKLLDQLSASLKKKVDKTEKPVRPEAQLVFCIDIRSEPFRRSLEAQGNYQTLGFAGFFGLPVRIHEHGTNETYDSCPVLLKPAHNVHEHPSCCDHHQIQSNILRQNLLGWPRKLYQSLKYNFSTPFALVEMLGIWCGLRMLFRTFAPSTTKAVKSTAAYMIAPDLPGEPDLSSIDERQQAIYAETALRMMGLTENFAPLVVFCGHGSTTTNNAYASALDCGACGGNHGGSNAKILAAILNKPDIRKALARNNLQIATDTLFLGAEHNTTTDSVDIFSTLKEHPVLKKLKADLSKAKAVNSKNRCRTFGVSADERASSISKVKKRSNDWAEVRPEWGLARNAAFIIAPRALTKDIDLDGRCFLHSYDWENDGDGKFLETILTAPMVVAQWINNQYLFSTLNNVAYGSGSKITQNVTGKIGVVQGNGSDLMHGLPLQSVYSADDKPYHEPMRLLTVVYAPRARIKALIDKHAVLQKLFGNGWVSLACLDPQDNKNYMLLRNLTWQTA